MKVYSLPALSILFLIALIALAEAEESTLRDQLRDKLSLSDVNSTSEESESSDSHARHEFFDSYDCAGRPSEVDIQGDTYACNDIELNTVVSFPCDAFS